MRHQDATARIRLQEVFDPARALGVDMVGRLVQQEHVRLGQQRARQIDPAQLAPRQFPQWAITRRQVQRGGKPVGLRVVDLPHVVKLRAVVDVLELLLKPRAFFRVEIGFRQSFRQGRVFARNRPQMVRGVFEHLAHGLIQRQRALLAQHRHRRPLPPGHAARAGCLQSGQNAEQGRLARSVPADQPHAFAFVHGQRDPLEHGLRAETFGHALRAEQHLADCRITRHV